MVPYWKRVPIMEPLPLLELDPTHQFKDEWDWWHTPNYLGRDPFDFYEDALGG